MIVGDLLALEELRLGLAWGTPELLGRQVTGVTSTDLQDPARYLQPGELVLSGLVWWTPGDAPGDAAAGADAAVRFATALRSAGVAALLAGEGTHGSVPPGLVEACRARGVPLLTVPAATSFRAVTDRIYLRLWGDLRSDARQSASLPETVRQELAARLGADAPLSEVLALAVARLGLPERSIRSATGRVVAGSDGAEVAGRLPSGALPLGPTGSSPFDGWYLVPGGHPTSPDLAELLAPAAAAARSAAAERRRAATRLFDLLGAGGPVDRAELADAIGACGLPPDLPLTPVTARIDRTPPSWALDALTEALHGTGAVFAAGPDRHGEATALVAGPVPEPQTLPVLVQPYLTVSQRLRIGVGPTVAPQPTALRAGLVRARYALASADPYAHADQVDSLAALLRGVPAEVAAAFRQRVLAPLIAYDRENSVSLLDTLAVFLDCDCSWARTSRALHLHVNTVHYRVRRIEELTGRELARLADQCELRTALLCAAGPVR